MADDAKQDNGSSKEDHKYSADGRFWRIPQWFQGLTSKELEQLRAYHLNLIHFNGRINLISPKTKRNAEKQTK